MLKGQNNCSFLLGGMLTMFFLPHAENIFFSNPWSSEKASDFVCLYSNQMPLPNAVWAFGEEKDFWENGLNLKNMPQVPLLSRVLQGAFIYKSYFAIIGCVEHDKFMGYWLENIKHVGKIEPPMDSKDFLGWGAPKKLIGWGAHYLDNAMNLKKEIFTAKLEGKTPRIHIHAYDELWPYPLGRLREYFLMDDLASLSTFTPEELQCTQLGLIAWADRQIQNDLEVLLTLKTSDDSRIKNIMDPFPQFILRALRVEIEDELTKAFLRREAAIPLEDFKRIVLKYSQHYRQAIENTNRFLYIFKEFESPVETVETRALFYQHNTSGRCRDEGYDILVSKTHNNASKALAYLKKHKVSLGFFPRGEEGFEEGFSVVRGVSGRSISTPPWKEVSKNIVWTAKELEMFGGISEQIKKNNEICNYILKTRDILTGGLFFFFAVGVFTACLPLTFPTIF